MDNILSPDEEDAKRARFIQSLNTCEPDELHKANLGHHPFSRWKRGKCEARIGAEAVETVKRETQDLGGVSPDGFLRALRLCCLGLEPARAALKVFLEEQPQNAAQGAIKAAMPDLQSLHGLNLFSYDPAMTEAMAAPLTQMLARRPHGPGPGQVFIYDMPTGTGKSYLMARALAREVVEAIRLYKEGRLKQPRVVMVVASTHSLVSGPADDLETELRRLNVDPNMFRLLRLTATQRHVKATLSGGRKADAVLPAECPAQKEVKASREISSLLNKMANDGEGNSQGVQRQFSGLMNTLCLKAAESQIKIDGCLPDACRTCTFRNPGEAIYGQSDVPVRVVFLTYHKLALGLRRMSTERTGDKTGKVVVQRLGCSSRTGAGRLEKITNTSIVFEECVQGFQSLWNVILEDRSSTDVFLLLEHLLSNIHVFDGAVEDFQAQVEMVRAKVSNFHNVLSAANKLKESVSELKTKLVTEMTEGFYLNKAEDRRHIYEGLAEGIVRRTDVRSSNPNKTVAELIETTDLAMSSLTDDRKAYYSLASLTDTRAVMHIGAKAELGSHALKASIPLRTLPGYVTRFMIALLSLKNQLDAACRSTGDSEHTQAIPPSVAVEIHDTLVERLKRGVNDDMREAIDHFLRSAMGSKRGVTDKNCLDTDDVATRFRRSGYRLVHLRHKEGPKQYDVLAEGVPTTPDGMVEELVEAGNDVMLMSATGTYDNPTETFSVPYLSRHHEVVFPSPEERASLEGAVAAKYAGRCDLEVDEVPLNLTKPKGSSQWRPQDPSAWHPALARFIADNPHLLNFSNDEEYKYGSHMDAVLALLSDVVSRPEDPRFAIIAVNSHDQAKGAVNFIKAFAEWLDALNDGVSWPSITACSLSSRDLEGNRETPSEFVEVNLNPLRDIQNDFRKSLLSSGRVMAAIVVAPYQTIGVGVNLQIKLPVTDLPTDGSLPQNLRRYVGADRTLRTFGLDAPLEIDVSDTVLALMRTKVVSEDNKVRYLLAMEADGRSDPALLGRTLGLKSMDLVSRLKKTDEYRTTILMGVVQAVGRADRCLNSPARQRLWMHADIMNMIGRLPRDVYEGTQRPLLTPSQRRMVDACRKGRSTHFGDWQFPDTGVDKRMKGLVGAFCGDYGPEAAALARGIWDILKVVGAQHQVVSEEFLSSPLSVEFDRLLTQLRHESEDPDAMPASLSELYMCIPVRGIREHHIDDKPLLHLDRSIYKEWATEEIVVRGHSASVMGADWFASLLSDLPYEVCHSAMPGRWVGREVVWDERTKKLIPTGLKQTLTKSQDGAVFLLRPKIMRDVGHPFIDEARTARVLTYLGATPGFLPPDLYEAVDHYTYDPPCVFNNKTFHRGYFAGTDAGSLLNKMVDRAREDLSRIVERLEAQAAKPTSYVYVMRHPLDPRLEGKPIVAVRRGCYELSNDVTDADVFFVTLSDRHEESLGQLLFKLRSR